MYPQSMSRNVATTKSRKVATTIYIVSSQKTNLHMKNAQAATKLQLAAATKPQHCCMLAAIHCQRRFISIRVGIDPWRLKLYKVYINDDPGLTLTYFMARSVTLVYMCLYEENCNSNNITASNR